MNSKYEPLGTPFDSWKEFMDICSSLDSVAEIRSAIHQHERYCFLKKDANFNLALKSFETIKGKAKGKSRLCDPSAEFSFLRIVARHIGLFVVTNGSAYEPRYPTPKERTAAIGHIADVLDDMDYRGVGLPDFHEQLELQNHLTRLWAQLKAEKRNPPAAPRKDSSLKYRELHANLAIDFKRQFDQPLPQVIKHLSRGVGSVLDDRIIELHIAQAVPR